MAINITYGNIALPRKMVCATATGVTPQRFVIWAVPQIATISAGGSLFFTDGFTSLTLTNCRTILVEVVYGTNGPLLKITGVDRRFLWLGKALDGRYNQRDAAGDLIAATEKSPRQLATLLWNAMGEPTANVSNLPNTDRPEINWECADAASELEDLCTQYGCVPSLDITTDTSGIYVEGQGNFLPNTLDLRWKHDSLSGISPQRIEACADYVQVQSKLIMEAVLQETDSGLSTFGQYLPADDVSYAPASGWAGSVSDLEEILQPDNPNHSEVNAERANDLWKVWRVKAFADGGFTPPPPFDADPVEGIEKLFPLRHELLQPYSGDDGAIGTQAYLIGTATLDHDPDPPNDNSDEGTRVDMPFSLDTATGMVRTSTALVKWNTADLTFDPADIWLVCTHRLTDATTNQYVRYVRFLLPGGSSGVSTIRRDDVIPKVVAQYGTGSDHATLTGSTDNLTTIDAILDEALNQQAARLAPKQSTIAEYNGIQPIGPDGAISSVTFLLDSHLKKSTPATDRNVITTAYRNTQGGHMTVYAGERARQQLSVHQTAQRLRRVMSDQRGNRRRMR